jgi:hypothetical protein
MLLVLGLIFACSGASCRRDGSKQGENLLDGRSPMRSSGVRRAEVLTDGKAVRDGDAWLSTGTAQFSSSAAHVDYDLGSERTLSAIWLQGDNNDEYDVLVSKDGTNFELAWGAQPVSEVGMQPRFVSGLKFVGRYVRIHAARGDDALSLSEVQIYSSPPPTFPPQIRRANSLGLEQLVRDRALVFGFALILLVLLARRGAARWWNAALWVVAAAAGAWAVMAFVDAWPVSNREVSLVRGVVAAVAAFAIVREVFSPPRFPAQRGVTLSVLGLCAVVGFLAFYNLGRPQFYHVSKGIPTLAHQLDLRQYYATAKYFEELGYVGIYEADVLAHAEENGTAVDALGRYPMRNLETLRDSTVSQERAHIEARRSHFSPERWQAYRADARYFRDAMGNHEYLQTMLDYGGNATPFWMSIAHLLFSAIPPNNTAFTLTGLIDAFLILLTLVAIGRTFGLRTALVCSVVFGANDFIMYGTNWGGSTLRHDWLAYLGLGAAALRSEKWLLGGIFFGFSTMIRAFPALALIGVSIQGGWWIFDYVRRERRIPAWRAFSEQNRGLLRVLLGAVLAIAAGFAFSVLVLSVDAWPEWYTKVRRLESGPHFATLSLRSLVGGTTSDQSLILRSRAPVYVAAVVLYTAGVIWGCRGKRPEQAAILALTLLPFLLSPANYYSHVVFLFPLLVIERAAKSSADPGLSAAEVGIWLSLLGMCALQYFTVLVPDLALHFYFESAFLILTLTVVLCLFLYERVRDWLWATPAHS